MMAPIKFLLILSTITTLAPCVLSAPIDNTLNTLELDTQYHIYMLQRPCDESVVPPPWEGCRDDKLFPDEGYPITHNNGSIGVFPFVDPQPEPLKWKLVPGKAENYFSLQTDDFEGVLVGNDDYFDLQQSNFDYPNQTIHSGEFGWMGQNSQNISFGNETKSHWTSNAVYHSDNLTAYYWSVNWVVLRKFPKARCNRRLLNLP
jgi:hypothetical protein